MMKSLFFCCVLIFMISCGGAQNVNTDLEKRPLEENKALEIISKVLTERGHQVAAGGTIQLSNNVTFVCDLKVNGKPIAIEYITQKDAVTMGTIPPAAPGSKLRVIPATEVVEQGDDGTPLRTPEAMYVFLLDETGYEYHYNPTSSKRGEVTLYEVESRLRRDLNDFITWFENKPQ